MGCKAAGRPLWIRQEKTPDPDFQAVTDVDNPRIQLVIVMTVFHPLNVTLSRPELRKAPKSRLRSGT